MWNARPTILEGEDEAALRDRFARLVAKYPNQSVFEIGDHVFKDLKDPCLRGQQAALIWHKDIEVLELIEQYKNGKAISDLPSKEDAARLVWSIAENSEIEMKDRLAAARLFGELNGMIVKAVDKTINDTRRRPPPQITFARYAD